MPPTPYSAAALACALCLPACSSPTAASPPDRVASPAPVASAAPTPSETPPRPAAPAARATPIEVPDWLRDRSVRAGAAISLVGGDASSVDVLFGQFEHPEEAIVRFDRQSGCAVSATGPFPTIAQVVRGREGFSGPKLSAEARMALAQSEAFRRELEGVVGVYARHGNTGEDKLAFSLDGRRVIVEATDERLLASSDGGRHFGYLEGDLVGMPVVDPAGRFAVVRACSGKRCIEPLKKSPHRAALVSFDDLPHVRHLAGPSMHDAIVDPGGAWVLTTRSDVHGRAAPSKLCFDVFSTPPRGAPLSSSCAATSWVGEWHMLGASKGARFGVVALVKPARGGKGEARIDPVRLSVRSLPDGAEKEVFDVAGYWADYQWRDVVVNDRGAIAYVSPPPPGAAEEVSDPYAPLSAGNHNPRPVVVRGGGVKPRTLAPGKPLGWLNDRELVVLDPAQAGDRHACGLVRVVDVEAGG